MDLFCLSLSSPSLGIWPAEGFYVPDPCELTFANTLLLSNADKDLFLIEYIYEKIQKMKITKR